MLKSAAGLGAEMRWQSVGRCVSKRRFTAAVFWKATNSDNECERHAFRVCPKCLRSLQIMSGVTLSPSPFVALGPLSRTIINPPYPSQLIESMTHANFPTNVSCCLIDIYV